MLEVIENIPGKIKNGIYRIIGIELYPSKYKNIPYGFEMQKINNIDNNTESELESLSEKLSDRLYTKAS